MSSDAPKIVVHTTPPAKPGAPPKKRKRAPYVPKGGKNGRRDIPWETIEELYVRGEMVGDPPARVWPSSEQIGTRFGVDAGGVRDHSRAKGWLHKREEFKRELAKSADEAAKKFVGFAADLWGPQAQRAWELNSRILEEAEFTLDFHKSGRAAKVAALARASAKGGRQKPSGGDTEAQEGAGPVDASAVEADPSLREPMPARDQKDLTTSIKTATDNLRALLLGTTAPGTAPTSAAQPGGATPAPLQGDARVQAVMEAFVIQAMRSNANPNAAPAAPSPGAAAPSKK